MYVHFMTTIAYQPLLTPLDISIAKLSSFKF